MSAWRTGLLMGALILTGCVQVESFRVLSVGASYWQPELDGEVRFSSQGIPGTDIDVVELLDIDRRTEAPVYAASVALGPFSLEGRYVDLEYRGDTTLTETISFLGQDFPITARVRSQLSGRMISGNLRFPLAGMESIGFLPRVMIGGLVGVRAMELKARLAALTPIQLEESDRTEVTFPVVGIVGAIEQPVGGDVKLFVDATLAGFPRVRYDDVEGRYLDVSVRAGVRLRDLVSLGVGWQSVALDFTFDEGTSDEDHADVDLEGLLLFGEVRF